MVPSPSYGRVAERFSTCAHTSDRSQSHCAVKDAESVMGVACVYGYTVSSHCQRGKCHPCPLLTPTSEAALLGFLTVTTALSLSLFPTPVGPLFLLGHWGSLGVRGLSCGRVWAENTLSQLLSVSVLSVAIPGPENPTSGMLGARTFQSLEGHPCAWASPGSQPREHQSGYTSTCSDQQIPSPAPWVLPTPCPPALHPSSPAPSLPALLLSQ